MAYGEISDDYIVVDANNIDSEHICCALSNAPYQIELANTKKAWLKDRFKEGLVFIKMNVRGKVFIEYMPAEDAFIPINAPGYMYIDCFWVAGAYAKHSAGTTLLNKCIADAKAKGKKGLVVISSKKKQPYLSDSRFLAKNGFMLADEGADGFQLYYLPFSDNAAIPSIKDCAKTGIIEDKGLVIYYSNQCVFSKATAFNLQALAKSKGADCKVVEYTTAQEAQNSPIPFTIYSLFDNGKLVSHVPMVDHQFLDYLAKRKK